MKADDDRVAVILGGFIDSFETNGDALNVEVYSTNNVPGNKFIFEAKKISLLQMIIPTTLVLLVLQKAVGQTTSSRPCQEVFQRQKLHMWMGNFIFVEDINQIGNKLSVNEIILINLTQ